MKKWMKPAALFCIAALMLCACGGEAVVPVVQVKLLTMAGETAEHFAGVVVSENAVEVQRDLEQTISETFVAPGDEVKKGQILFRYDSDALKLTQSKQELELERLEADTKETKSQIAEVKKELEDTKDDALKTQLNIRLRQLEADLTQAKYDKEDLKADIDHTKDLLRNVNVKSPIDGTVRRIDEAEAAYIIIQQTGAYQVQGTLNELSLNAGIQVGAEVIVVSRLDETKTWHGTVAEVDFGNNTSNSYDSMYGEGDLLSTSTNYPFTVTLDSTDGLLLGQHVYIRLAGINEGSADRILIPESYLMDYSYDAEALITTANVWCPDEEGKLMKQELVLGEYVEELGCYVVLRGLSLDGYVADPSNPDCAEGADTDLRAQADFAPAPEAPEVPETTQQSVPQTSQAPEMEE